MSLPPRTTVLIVGAGPTGLAAALSLLHHGFHDFIIVDAIPQSKNASRAIIVHAATLEALDTIGCGDEIASQGIKCTAFNIGTRSTKLLSPHVESLKPYTRYPYILSIPQNVTERILARKLSGSGIVIHRPLKVVGLKCNTEDPEFSDVTFEDGSVITAKYVIGADGVHSVVRTTAGIGFSDPKGDEEEPNNNFSRVVLADVTFDSVDSDQGALSGTVSKNSFFIFFPLPFSFNEALAADGKPFIHERLYRMACGVPLEDGELPQSPSRDYLQNLADCFGPYHLTSDPSLNPTSKSTRIKDVIWSSRYLNRAAVADAMFARLDTGGRGAGGVIILIGDAAHIHSPLGGQGMNLGLRDAIFLGDVLTNHLHSAKTEPLSKADGILREFSNVRHARALEVIGLTKGLMSVVGMSYRKRVFWWCPLDSDTLRAWMLWVLGKIPFFQSRLAWQLSGLGRR